MMFPAITPADPAGQFKWCEIMLDSWTQLGRAQGARTQRLSLHALLTHSRAPLRKPPAPASCCFLTNFHHEIVTRRLSAPLQVGLLTART